MRYEISDKNNKKYLLIMDSIINEPNVSDFYFLLNKLIDEGAKEIIIDFLGCNLLGSAAIGKLMMAYKRLKNENGKIFIVNLNNDLYNLFISLKLNEHFIILKSLNEIV